MQFSLYLSPQTPGAAADGSTLRDATEHAIRGDELGFAAVVLTEHHLVEYNTYGDPFVFGSWLAGQMSQAWVIHSVTVPALHHPLRVAEKANLLDALSQGRCIIGLGPGGIPIEFANFGADPVEAVARYEEAVDLLPKFWAHTGEDAPLEYRSIDGGGRLEGRVVPSSFRQPHPYLARTAVSEASFIRTGQLGIPVFSGRLETDVLADRYRKYFEALHSSGHSQETIDHCERWTGVNQMIMVTETDEEAQRAIIDPLDNYLATTATFRPKDVPRAVDTDPRFAHLSQSERDAAERDVMLSRTVSAGTPDKVVEDLQVYRDMGVNHVMCWMQFGFMAPDRVARSLELFATEVMPRLTDDADPSSVIGNARAEAADAA